VVADLSTAGIPDATTSLIANKHVSAAHDDVKEHTAAGTGLGAQRPPDGRTAAGRAGRLGPISPR